jgi:hypothetical protein
MKIHNAKQKPARFFGLHMAEGVAEYREEGQQPYRIFVGEETLKEMDPTYEGCPVYVMHVDEVNLDNLQTEADGYVVKSFFNKADGKHWAEFIIVSDRAHEALRGGWKLSNAYIPKQMGPGGQWHGVDFSKEITDGVYEHLAIVPNPRYMESIVLTPEEFAKYNADKEAELKKLSNSQGEKSMFSLFKKQKVENSAELVEMSVVLPKSKIERTVAQLINEADAMEHAKKNDDMVAHPESHVLVGKEKMKINDLIKKYQDMCNELEVMKKEKEEKEAVKDDADAAVKEMKKDDDDAGAAKHEEEVPAVKKVNDEVPADDKEALKKTLELAEHEVLEMEGKKKNNFEKLKNAEQRARDFEVVRVELSEDKVARGKSRYGSN